MHGRARVEGGVLADRVVRARGFCGRLRGLMGWPRLEPGEGMLITPCNSIHTAFMRFPIDVVFLDRSDRVIALRRGVVPWRMAQGGWSARSALELPEGGAGALALGDQVHWEWAGRDSHASGGS